MSGVQCQGFVVLARLGDPIQPSETTSLSVSQHNPEISLLLHGCERPVCGSVHSLPFYGRM
jgi:hypothetical protein